MDWFSEPTSPQWKELNGWLGWFIGWWTGKNIWGLRCELMGMPLANWSLFCGLSRIAVVEPWSCWWMNCFVGLDNWMTVQVIVWSWSWGLSPSKRCWRTGGRYPVSGDVPYQGQPISVVSIGWGTTCQLGIGHRRYLVHLQGVFFACHVRLEGIPVDELRSCKFWGITGVSIPHFNPQQMMTGFLVVFRLLHAFWWWGTTVCAHCHLDQVHFAGQRSQGQRPNDFGDAQTQRLSSSQSYATTSMTSATPTTNYQ